MSNKTQNSKPQYDIEAVTYTKKFVGIDTKTGRRKYETVGEPKREIVKEKKFSDLKQRLYEDSQKNEDMFVDYKNPTYRLQENPKRINSVTVKKSGSQKEVTYFRVVKKCDSSSKKKC